MSRTDIKVIVADDHALFRAGLIRMLDSFPGVTVAAEAENGGEVIDTIKRFEADVLILDLSMPGVSGVSLIIAVHEAMPDLPILILSMHDEAALVKQALKSGASGYITKNSDPDTLFEAVAKLAHGGRFVAPYLAESLAFDDGGRPGAAGLSARELQVLRLLVEQGLSLIEIAERLDLSPKTVTTHKANIMAKLGVANNVELIRRAIDSGLIG